MLVQVSPVACGDIGRGDPVMGAVVGVVKGSAAGQVGGAGIGWEFYQNVDGRIFNVNGGVVGNRAVEQVA